MKTKNSDKLFEKSKNHIAGGVNSPVRAFKSVGGSPIFFRKSRGCYLYDEDGNKYLDFVGSWGPMILGHSNNTCLRGSNGGTLWSGNIYPIVRGSWFTI